MRLTYAGRADAVAVGDEIITASGYWRKVRVLPPQGGMVVLCEGFDGETVRTPLKTLGAEWTQREQSRYTQIELELFEK